MDSARSVPVTMLSGFLGVGKTTLLRELLSQTELRIGCIVNDVAAVNIDAKLVRNQQFQGASANSGTVKDLAPTIELENGCACCSIQDELMLSFEQLLAVSDRNGKPFDRIVLENSGVAEPRNIRDKFVEAAEDGHPLMKRLHLSTLVTVVDSASFISDFACRNALATRPDLGGNGSMLPVVALLVEQVEIADYVILNKVDLLGEERVPELTAIIQTINPLCEVIPCSHGKFDLNRVFGANAREILASLNVEGQHRGYVAKIKQQHEHAAAPPPAAGASAAAGGCTKDHEHGPNCQGHQHTHDHDHDHKHDGHDHKHEHGHHAGECGHKHEHEHGHACTKDHVHGPDCAHGHDDAHRCTKDHVHGPECGHTHRDRTNTTAKERFGITNFVYSRRRPFHPQRLKALVINAMPPPARPPGAGPAPPRAPSPMTNVLRSKGFVWLSSGHSHAYYWSHAGQHFEVIEEGEWWASVADEDWPTEQQSRAVILSDFQPGFRYGDRRQEIVFIGTNMDDAGIQALLDEALLTDEEMGKYDENWAKLPDPEHADAPRA